MEKTSSGNFFEDFEIGSTIQHALPRTVTESDNALYIALTGDRYPLYSYAEFAQSLGYRRELINDLLVFHTVLGKTVSDISLNATANLGYAEVLFLRPVYPGDTLRAESTILGKKENSKSKTGTVYVHTKGYNQYDEVILQFYRWIRVNKHYPDAITEWDEKPEMPSEIRIEEYQPPTELKRTGLNPAITGGKWFFEDYEVGERICHTDARTIEESDHMQATSAYLNLNNMHFNQHLMAHSRFGKRVMYGGHVISIARSLSFNGLENALGIIGWNNSTHVHPTFGGDTLYAWSDILEKKDLSGHDDLGALRIRLVALKNLDPTQPGVALKFMDPEKEKEQYHPNVVLDLDYYILMPKQI